MRRILFVATSSTLGGAEKTVHTLASRLDRKRFEVAGLVSLKPLGFYAERLRGAGIPVRSLDIGGLPGPGDVSRLSRLIDEFRPDIVQAVMYQAIQLCRLAKGRTRASFKLISSPRVNYRSRSIATLLVDRWLKKRDDLAVCECEASRLFLIERLGYASEKVRTVYNGVDLPSASSGPSGDPRASLGLGPGDLLLGSVGRLDRQKGYSALISAVAELGTRVPLQCVIIGDGPERPALEDQIRRLGLAGRVILKGEIADASSWMGAFDIFVLPSLWEGLPNALLEAMARGLPVVASSVDGIAEVVEDGVNGLLVAAQDSRALAGAVLELAQDSSRRERFGREAKSSVLSRFTLERMLAGYEQAYVDVLP